MSVNPEPSRRVASVGFRPVAPCYRRRAATWLALLLVLAGAVGVAAAQTDGVIRDSEPGSGLLSWQARFGDLSLRLVQRLPDQTRAFFLGRGFSRGAVEELAARCVFQAVVRNVASEHGELAVDLTTWRIEGDRLRGGLLLDGDWQPRWERLGESRAARIAFRWALLPTRQQFLPADWNMGMIVLDASSGAKVDLQLDWRRDGVRHAGEIDGLECGE